MQTSNAINEKYQVKTYQVNDGLSYTIAAEANVSVRKGNGGLRFYQYDTTDAQESEALVLAQHMTQKHQIYNTGFSGAKIVANGSIDADTKRVLLKHLGKTLNELDGNLYTGCDLNMNNNDMDELATITPYILNALDAPHVNTSTATALGVFGSLMSVIDFNNESDRTLTFVVHGLGKIGRVIAEKLIEKGHRVYGFDINPASGDIPGLINVSDNADWHTIECDYLLLCSASNIITEKNVREINCRWIVSSANSPFANQKVEQCLIEQGIQWIPDVVSNAGAVICDAVEFESPDEYRSIDAELLYQQVYQRIYDKTETLLIMSQKYQLRPDQALSVFFSMAGVAVGG